VRKNILFRPAGEVEHRPGWQEIETGLGKLEAVFALEPLVELLL